MAPIPNNTRRRLLGAIAAAPLLGPATGRAQRQTRPATWAIPSSGEAVPLVGLGSWITFNVGNDRVARDACAEVTRAFFLAGGRLIDSSPMYGSAQEVIGYGLKKLGRPADLFAADKVWIADGAEGRAQIEASRRLWGIPRFDLMQVHNLLSWQAHLPTLFAMKAAGQLRYVGITTSHGRRHDELERIMAGQPLDFVQLTYNLIDRDAEQRLLGSRGSAASPSSSTGRSSRARCSTGWGAGHCRRGRPKSTAPVGPSSPSSSSFRTRPLPARFRRPQMLHTCGRTWARRPVGCRIKPCVRAWPRW